MPIFGSAVPDLRQKAALHRRLHRLHMGQRALRLRAGSPHLGRISVPARRGRGDDRREQHGAYRRGRRTRACARARSGCTPPRKLSESAPARSQAACCSGTLGWPWVFWINVPFGLLSIVLGWFVLPVTARQNPGQTFDWRGALLLAPALALAVLALNQVSAWGLTSPALLGSVGAAIVLIFLFVRQEGRTRSPLVDLALLEGPCVSGRRARLRSLLRDALRHVLPRFVRARQRLRGQPRRRGAQARDHSDQHRHRRALRRRARGLDRRRGSSASRGWRSASSHSWRS